MSKYRKSCLFVAAVKLQWIREMCVLFLCSSILCLSRSSCTTVSTQYHNQINRQKCHTNISALLDSLSYILVLVLVLPPSIILDIDFVKQFL